MRWSGVEEIMQGSAEEQKMSGEEAMFKSGYVSKAGVTSEKDGASKQDAQAQEEKDPNEGKAKAICDNCQDDIYIKFQPDDKRNVFCAECLKDFKAGKINVAKLPKRNVPARADDGIIRPGTPQAAKIAKQETPQAEDKSISLNDAVKQDPVDFKDNN